MQNNSKQLIKDIAWFKGEQVAVLDYHVNRKGIKLAFIVLQGKVESVPVNELVFINESK